MDPRTRSRLALIAGRQLGLLTRAQLLDHVAEAWIYRRLRDGDLAARAPGVYALWGAPDSFEQRVLAAQLAVGRQAPASGATAAHLWAIPRVARPPTIELTTLGRCRSKAAVVRETSVLLPEDVDVVGGIEVFALPRTLADNAHRGASWLENAMVAMIARGLLEPVDLAVLADRSCGARGIGAVRQVLGRFDLANAGYRSNAEFEVDAAVRAMGLPGPLINKRFWFGRWYELDLSWPDHRYNHEIDGPHHALPDQQRADRKRDATIADGRWKVHRTPVIDVDDHLDRVVAQIADDLRSRGWLANRVHPAPELPHARVPRRMDPYLGY